MSLTTAIMKRNIHAAGPVGSSYLAVVSPAGRRHLFGRMKMWHVKWYNYYWMIETLTLSTEQIMACLRFDHDYYLSIEPA